MEDEDAVFSDLEAGPADPGGLEVAVGSRGGGCCCLGLILLLISSSFLDKE